jgi:hypothetical protein
MLVGIVAFVATWLLFPRRVQGDFRVSAQAEGAG